MNNLIGCLCTLRTKLVGDGCEICNPAKALEYAKETIADLEQQAILRDLEIVRLREALEYVVDSGLLVGPTELHDMVLKQVYEAIRDPIDATTLTAYTQQVKSEDAVIVGTLRINEYREYDFIPADLITPERALPTGTYELTAAISAQEEKGRGL